jgi:hypothetical protein
MGGSWWELAYRNLHKAGFYHVAGRSSPKGHYRTVLQVLGAVSEPNWRSNAARVTPSDSCPNVVESAAGANVLYSCTASILVVDLYEYSSFDLYISRHCTAPRSISLQAVNEFLISQNVFGQIWIQKYLAGQIGIEMYSLHSDVHFSNLMDALRLYNHLVGQEIQSQPTSENSELAADLCGGKIKNSFCYLKYT